VTAAKKPINMQESANNAKDSAPDPHAEDSFLATAIASSSSIVTTTRDFYTVDGSVIRYRLAGTSDMITTS
jgi:hypothetical protein